jgi:hypothetical protein
LVKEKHSEMAFTENDRQKMDNAATDAQNTLMEMDDLDDETLRRLGSWWRDNVGDAGHRRLGRIILEFADEKSK